MRINLAVIGACGRMGRQIARLATEGDVFNLCGVIDTADNLDRGKNYNNLTGVGDASLVIKDSLINLEAKPDVVIDFSSRIATLGHLKSASELKIPYVIGTTGFDKKETELIREYSLISAVLLSPNMSLGVNVMFLAAELLGRLIGESYDIEIIEAHHNQKADAPSGTALKLFDSINKTLKGTLSPVYGRNGIVGKRGGREVGIHAVRAGDIVGEHTLLFAGMGEEISLSHRALTRETFAKGALKCAEYLYNKPAGFYDMKSVLGL